MSVKIIETERFLLREFVPDDAQMFYSLNLDPEVTRYTGDTSFDSLSAAWMFLDDYIDTVYERDGFGRWAIVEKETGIKWGWCGLKKRENGEIDMGYRLFKKYWGKGCASECGQACLQHAFDNLNIERLIAEAVEVNAASFRVMERLGFKFVKKGEDHGFVTRIYELTKEDYLNSKGA